MGAAAGITSKREEQTESNGMLKRKPSTHMVSSKPNRTLQARMGCQEHGAVSTSHPCCSLCTGCPLLGIFCSVFLLYIKTEMDWHRHTSRMSSGQKSSTLSVSLWYYSTLHLPFAQGPHTNTCYSQRAFVVAAPLPGQANTTYSRLTHNTHIQDSKTHF